MKFTYSALHHQHAPEHIMVRGTMAPNLEAPVRAETLLKQLCAQGHEQVSPQGWGQKWIAAVHDAGYLEFLSTAHERWRQLPNATPVIHPHASLEGVTRTRTAN